VLIVGERSTEDERQRDDADLRDDRARASNFGWPADRGSATRRSFQ
jgi:hypothetical protein